KPTQRPTEKTAPPRHPFFIGSWPEPVSRCWQRWLGLCAWSEDSAHWSRDLPLRCWLCPCLWESTLVLAGP
uniref:Uncharacterized protein n=1 Tax=Saimiri boliviensis boliviensis TaxID=39432 RepID=A0A2K6TT40_SAIBB